MGRRQRRQGGVDVAGRRRSQVRGPQRRRRPSAQRPSTLRDRGRQLRPARIRVHAGVCARGAHRRSRGPAQRLGVLHLAGTGLRRHRSQAGHRIAGRGRGCRARRRPGRPGLRLLLGHLDGDPARRRRCGARARRPTPPHSGRGQERAHLLGRRHSGGRARAGSRPDGRGSRRHPAGGRAAQPAAGRVPPTRRGRCPSPRHRPASPTSAARPSRSSFGSRNSSAGTARHLCPTRWSCRSRTM